MGTNEMNQPLDPLAQARKMQSALSGFWKLMAEMKWAERHVRRRGEAAFAASTFSFDPDAAFWVMWILSGREELNHYLFFGATDNRETIAIHLRVQTPRSQFAPSSTETKQPGAFGVRIDNLSPVADSCPCPEETHSCILDSLNKAAGVWNVADAVQTPRMAFALASFLVPEDRICCCRFFGDAARELVYWVILALNHIAGRHWTLHDLFRALDSADSIARITSVLPDDSRVRHGFLEDKKHLASILSTLSVGIEPFKRAADLHGPACVSLWLLGGIISPGRVN